jgi:hypothetical protein
LKNKNRRQTEEEENTKESAKKAKNASAIPTDFEISVWKM